MISYLKSSFQRKIARHITKEYPTKIDTYKLTENGSVQFANWRNPLVSPAQFSEDMIIFFKKFIKEGDFTIDIGANIGDTTVPMALCSGVNGLTLPLIPTRMFSKY